MLDFEPILFFVIVFARRSAICLVAAVMLLEQREDPLRDRLRGAAGGC